MIRAASDPKNSMAPRRNGQGRTTGWSGKGREYRGADTTGRASKRSNGLNCLVSINVRASMQEGSTIILQKFTNGSAGILQEFTIGHRTPRRNEDSQVRTQ
jgi:hypothetical protein